MTPVALAERLGVAVPDGLADELAATLDETRIAGCAALEAAGLVPRGSEASPLARLELPASVAEVLTLTIAEARAAGRPDHADALALHYLDALPRTRLEQLLTRRAPESWLFHEPLPWEALPRLRGGLERIFGLLSRHGLDAGRALGAPTLEAWTAARPTLGDLYVETYYGRLLPMFQAMPHDLAALGRELAARSPGGRWAVVDQRLATAIQHEVLHFRPTTSAIFPPYLDEAFAAHLGLLVDRWVACPEPGRDDAVVGWPWFAQVGEAFARAFGDGPLLAAQSGLASWREALPPALVDACERLGWEAYRAHRRVDFHPDTTRPDRWVRLAYAARAGLDVARLAGAGVDGLAALDALDWRDLHAPPDPERDRTILRNGLEAACSTASTVGGSWRVRRRPPDGPVTIDAERGLLLIPPRDPRSGEDGPTRYALPPVPLRTRTLTIEDASPGALDALARGLLEGPP